MPVFHVDSEAVLHASSAAQQSKAAARRPRGPVGKNAPRKQK